MSGSTKTVGLGFDTIKFRLNGVSPLILHSCEGVNPTHPILKEIKKLTKKPAKQKTEDDALKLMDLEYALSIYHDSKLDVLDENSKNKYYRGTGTPPKGLSIYDGIGPFIPAENLEALIRDGAKKVRLGKSAEAGILVEPDRIPIIYTGPRDIWSLIENPSFRDVRAANVQKAKVLRCRPRFNNWELEFEVKFLPSVIDRETVINALTTAGQLVGLCDFRPRYGRFVVEEI